jgi:hypothetical protein
MHILKPAVAALAALSLAACGSKTACKGLTDLALVGRVAAEAQRQPAADPAEMKFGQARVRGIGRSEAQGVTQLWFAQDDHTLTVANLTDACQASFRPGLAPDAIQQAAYPARPARF